jgi:hypothetical protein
MKLRLSLTVAAIGAVAAAVVPYAIAHTADTAAGAAQFSGSHQHHAAAVESHQRPAKPSAAPTPRVCPSSPTTAATLWSSSLKPTVASSRSDSAATLGVMVVPNKSGEITGVAFWKGTGNDGEHTASLWTDGKRLGSGTFRNESASGWQWLTLAHPVQVKAGQHVLATYRAPEGHFAFTPGAITPGGVCSGALRATDGTLWSNHRSSRHNSTSRTTNYFVNLRFVPTGATAPDPSPSPTSKPTVQPTDPKPTVRPTTPPTHSQTPTPTPKPTPKPTSPPPTTSSAWPGASNTGVPAGTKLTSSGSLDVNTDGTVINGRDITGTVTIHAKNVTIENSRIEAGGSQWGVEVTSGSLTMKDTEITGSGFGAVEGDNYTLDRVNIHDFHGDGMKLGNNVTVEDSWIHNAATENGQHADGMQLQNGLSNVVIKHNYVDPLESGSNSAVFIKNDLGPNNTTGPVLVDDNLLGGGGYTLYVYKGSSGMAQGGVTIENNHFLSDQQYGPVAVNIPVVAWANNILNSNGQGIKQ